MYRKYFAAAFAASFLALLPTSASATQNHEDPCPDQHVQVYNENSFVKIPHFVCAGDLRGPKGETGAKGADGKDGKDGSDSVVAGPAGRDGADGASGAAGPAGPQGAPGVAGDAGGVGPAGPTGAVGAQGEAGAPGADGKATSGARGPAGPAGKAGVTKTVIVEADGTVTEISPLPETGGDSDTYRLAALGLGLTALGTAVVLIYRRRK